MASQGRDLFQPHARIDRGFTKGMAQAMGRKVLQMGECAYFRSSCCTPLGVRGPR
jgi:hypothetical protein